LCRHLQVCVEFSDKTLSAFRENLQETQKQKEVTSSSSPDVLYRPNKNDK